MKQANTIASIPAPDQVGTPFAGGFYGGKIVSHGGLKLYAVAWAPKALGEADGTWLPRKKDVPGATSCWHSMDNTRALAQAGSKLAQWALGLDINGFSDWCLPARDVLELGYRHLKPTSQKNWASFRDGDNPSAVPAGYPYTGDFPVQTFAEAFREGGAEAFSPAVYWSSTQFSAGSAWGQDFDVGDQYSHVKSSEFRARACRLILLNP